MLTLDTSLGILKLSLESEEREYLLSWQKTSKLSLKSTSDLISKLNIDLSP